MNPPPPFDAPLTREIDALDLELDAVLTRHPRGGCRLEPFAARRRALLAAHLGFTPRPGFETITCLGDSNTMFFAGSERLRFIRYRRSAFWKPRWINRGTDLLPLFRTFHLGPATAWKAFDPGSSTRSREKLEILLRKDITPGSRIILSFGEIDCRIHMARAILAGADLHETVAKTAAKFIHLPLALLSRGFRPLIWAPPQIVPKDENLTSPTFPFIGSWEFRRDITYAYIEALRSVAAPHGIPVLSLTGLYHPREEKADLSYFYDGAHLSQRLMPLTLRLLESAGFLDLEPAS